MADKTDKKTKLEEYLKKLKDKVQDDDIKKAIDKKQKSINKPIVK